MRHGSLFSGIGGFDLAAQWISWDNIFHCEWNPFCQKVLNHYWPNAKSYEDITKSDFTQFRGTIDILTGGFPCQPFSTAGKRKGTEDSRYLWPEMLRVIREVQPRYIVGENVRGLVSWDGGLVFDTVCADLEAEGYEVLPVLLPAASVNAPHKRDRIWFVAFNSKSCRSSKVGGIFKGENNESFGICGSDKQTNAIDSNNKGGGSGLGQIQEADGEISERNNDAQFGNSNQCIASDSDSIGCSLESKKERPIKSDINRWMDKNIGHDRNQIWSKIDGCGSNATNASNTGLQRSQDIGGVENIGTKSDQQFAGFFCTDWQKFPTVSPVCHGDDGLSDRLDGITLSKWRNESIKAGGNAIVPQVAYQIFKTIEAYERLFNRLPEESQD